MENKGEIVIFESEDGLAKLNVNLKDENVWLSLDQMAILFDRDKSTISRHISNVLEDNELTKDSVVANFATTAADGKKYQVDYYNLDVIISVGYRVKSQRGVRFRIWASEVIKEYMKKGFAMDDARLKKLGGGGYFKELIERIRDIRATENNIRKTSCQKPYRDRPMFCEVCEELRRISSFCARKRGSQDARGGFCLRWTESPRSRIYPWAMPTAQSRR